uniref:Transposase Tc1-like domain-containing protein n=1 Tax=Tetranychus urticae TaxID=32264 RepID=A0A158P4N6_TETUR
MYPSSENERKRNEVCFVLKNITNNIKNCANLTNVSPRTVLRVKKRLKSGQSIKRKPGSGQSPTLNSTDRRRLGRIVQNCPVLSNEQIANRLSELGAAKVSSFTIGRELKKLKIQRFKPRYKPFLSASHINRRIEFCKENSARDWSKVVFSDEASFQLNSNSCLLLGKTRPTYQRSKYCQKIMVWGCISARGHSALKICRRSIDSKEYIETIKNFLVGTMDALS